MSGSMPGPMNGMQERPMMGPMGPAMGGGQGMMPGMQGEMPQQGMVPDSAGQAEADDIASGVIGPPGRFWAEGEYLNWRQRGMYIPLLVYEGTAADPTVIAAPLFGNERVEDGYDPGYRVTLGTWFDSMHRFGIQGDYFELTGRSQGFNSGLQNGFDAAGNPAPLAVPVSNLAGFNPDVITNPSGFNGFVGLTGQIQVETASYFQSAGIDGRVNIFDYEWSADGSDNVKWPSWSTRGFQVDFLAGYRLYRLVERASVQTQSVVSDSESAFNGDQFGTNDSFATSNTFTGADLGLTSILTYGRLTLQSTTRISLGDNYQVANINGSSTVTDISTNPATVTNSSGGILTSGSNIGNYNRTRFTAIPQLSTEVGYQVTDHFKATLGYDYIYWMNVARAGDLIPARVDAGATPPLPQFSFSNATYWAQGLHVGAEVRY